MYGVTFMTHDGAKWVLEQNADFEGSKFGPIIIRDNSFIGVNAIIMPGVVIGPSSVVGAGAVVTKDVPPNTVYAGNPARFISTYEEYFGEVPFEKHRKHSSKGAESRFDQHV